MSGSGSTRRRRADLLFGLHVALGRLNRSFDRRTSVFVLFADGICRERALDAILSAVAAAAAVALAASRIPPFGCAARASTPGTGEWERDGAKVNNVERHREAEKEEPASGWLTSLRQPMLGSVDANNAPLVAAFSIFSFTNVRLCIGTLSFIAALY